MENWGIIVRYADPCFFGQSKASISGRIRDKTAKQAIAKQLQGVSQDVPLMNLQTGVIKTKKAKREKSQAEELQAEMKKMQKKSLD